MSCIMTKAFSKTTTRFRIFCQTVIIACIPFQRNSLIGIHFFDNFFYEADYAQRFSDSKIADKPMRREIANRYLHASFA